MKIRAEDAAQLLYAAMLASKRFEHMDSSTPLSEYKKHLAFNVEVPISVIEGCLYGIKLLGEGGVFWHPTYRSAEEMIEALTPRGLTLDSNYNILSKKEEKEK